jgi:hypothetical protein
MRQFFEGVHVLPLLNTLPFFHLNLNPKFNMHNKSQLLAYIQYNDERKSVSDILGEATCIAFFDL